MRVLLVAMGSMGDTFPFLSLGKRMMERGHEVTLVASGYFKERIESEGMRFRESWSEEEYRTFVRNQATWSDREGLRAMADIVENMTERVYAVLAEEYVPGETVAAAQGYAFGARIAQEKLGLPLATVHLQPMWFRSIYDPPGLPNWFPRFFPRWIDRLIDVAVDYRLARPTNRYRAELGLPRKAKRVMKGWWNSPQLVMGFFPDWFNPPQPDWPPNVVLPGFPIYKGSGSNFDMTEVEAFLAAGDPPLVFSQSSITTDTEYFAVSARAAVALGRRAVFLVAHPEQVPDSLPGEVRCYSFVPLEKLLPRAAAHIHHGGIGTIGHTLEAGIPQLTVPMVYDQPDNAQRLHRLGVSVMLKRKAYTVEAVTRGLAELLGSRAVAERCRDFAARCRATDGLDNAAAALEGLHARTQSRPHGLAAR